jgi:hypothetical protein
MQLFGETRQRNLRWLAVATRRQIVTAVQYLAHQFELADESTAVDTHQQVEAHAETVSPAQLPIDVVAGMLMGEIMTAQHLPVSSKCSIMVNIFTRAR